MTKPHQPSLSHWIDVAWGIALAAAVLFLYGLVGEQSYQDEQAEFEHTCEMIEAGAWPASVEPACADQEN